MNIKPLSDPYHTPEIQIDPFSRLFPSAAFYARILAIVCEAAWRTRGGGYSMEKWAEDSLTVMRRAEAVGIRFHIENNLFIHPDNQFELIFTNQDLSEINLL